MINEDSDALECDLAEVYHIYEMRELPLHKVALFSCGLGEDSRIMRKLNNIDYKLDTLLLASILDRTTMNVYMNTKDAEKRRNKPKSVLESLLYKEKEEDKVMSFKDGQSFEIMRQRILEKGE